MADQTLVGSSVKGYQLLGSTPSTYKRAYLLIDGGHPQDARLLGTLIVSQRFAAGYDKDYVYATRQIWGQGLVLQNLPAIAEGVNARWYYAVQWRVAGIGWSLYNDTAT